MKNIRIIIIGNFINYSEKKKEYMFLIDINSNYN